MAQTLDQGAIGRSYTVLSFEGLPEATARRLESIGMTPGVVIDVLNNKSHGTVIVRLRETRWAMGRTLSSGIQVEPAEPKPLPPERNRFVPVAASSAVGAPGVWPGSHTRTAGAGQRPSGTAEDPDASQGEGR
ncbi:FeoA family protein [Olsenella sp. YH-ols2217]|uniref:FeoA family protein n=1 Tax=Kribbibacterium absianum TaxID=3044210 RepID=A0ABT6ZIC1_9ACTN|nr:MULTISPECIES: FeoA family protein [unclassified Olsenella]MDJ1121317.1 FeoA family protein [Olsenella sp. YH-ols2216]MDJ1128807.1 FeoA family protein [Olsenella sp. YH-ols2217]